MINSKMFFGQLGENYSIFIIVAVAISALAIMALVNQTLWPYVALVLGGAISNVSDRFLYGGVIDYLKVPLIPIFNLADSFIVIGIICLFLNLIFANKKTAS